MNISIPASSLGRIVLDARVAPKLDFETKQPKVDEEGNPYLLARVSVLSDGADRAESISVTLPYSQVNALSDSIQPLSEVTFKGLVLHVARNKNGSIVWFTASEIEEV